MVIGETTTIDYYGVLLTRNAALESS